MSELSEQMTELLKSAEKLAADESPALGVAVGISAVVILLLERIAAALEEKQK